MADLYTSYETSVALRDAGAPQNTQRCWIVLSDDGKPIMTAQWHPNAPCAFRADEIIEALDASGLMVEVINTQPDEGVGRWAALVDPSIDFLVPLYYGRAASLVEALATAWLAVLKEEK